VGKPIGGEIMLKAKNITLNSRGGETEVTIVWKNDGKMVRSLHDAMVLWTISLRQEAMIHLFRERPDLYYRFRLRNLQLRDTSQFCEHVTGQPGCAIGKVKQGNKAPIPYLMGASISWFNATEVKELTFCEIHYPEGWDFFSIESMWIDYIDENLIETVKHLKDIDPFKDVKQYFDIRDIPNYSTMIKGSFEFTYWRWHLFELLPQI